MRLSPLAPDPVLAVFGRDRPRERAEHVGKIIVWIREA
jgi:hypothetical protein